MCTEDIIPWMKVIHYKKLDIKENKTCTYGVKMIRIIGAQIIIDKGHKPVIEIERPKYPCRLSKRWEIEENIS